MTDHPPVPRPKRGWGVWVMTGLCGVITAGYSYAAITQHEFGSPAREEVPASVRASPGGYRSFHFWHSGYHGGK